MKRDAIRDRVYNRAAALRKTPRHAHAENDSPRPRPRGGADRPHLGPARRRHIPLPRREFHDRPDAVDLARGIAVRGGVGARGVLAPGVGGRPTGAKPTAHRHARPCAGHPRRDGAIRVVDSVRTSTWMAGTSPAMTDS